MPESSATWTKERRGPGRPKGLANKKTRVMREFLAQVALDNQEEFTRRIQNLSDKDFTQAYLIMLEYCTPKLARIEVKAQVEKRTVQVIEIDGTKIPI